jgi:capsular exopolysaccharide synthesis family protein
MDQCFTTEEELSETAGIEVLASIPHQTLLKRNQPLKGTQAIRRNIGTDIKLGQRLEMVVQKAPPVQLNYMVSACAQASVMAEQFRVLQARLEQVQRTKGFKLICVTSAVKGEGKTFTAVNLAITMARDFAKKTLLMDMDCKSPMLQRLAGREDQADLGWADVIMRKCELQETLIPFHTEKLFLLLAGKVNHPSSSLITSPGFYGLLQDLRREFDYIVVDAPPILPLADLRLLEDLVDGIILVIRAEATTRDVAVKALTSLQRDKVLGVVLNDRRRDSKHYHDYYDNGSDLLKGGRK